MKKWLFVFALCGVFALARVDDFIAEANIIKAMLDESVELYKNGKADEAKKKSEDAYFQHFENMEGAVGRNIGRKAITMERKFTNLRRMYKDRVELSKAQALVDSLKFDLDEVAPIVQNGFRLVAEKTDDGKTQSEVEQSSVAANAARASAADDMFAMFGDVSSQTSQDESANLENNSQNSQQNARQDTEQNAGQNAETNSPSDDTKLIAELQAAAAIDPKLQFLMDNISTKFSQAANALKNSNLEEAKALLNSALFEDYRNSKAEIAVSNHTTAGFDSKIQQGIRELIRKINANELNERVMRQALEEVENIIYDAFLQIPADQLSSIIVAGFDENANKGRDYSKVADDIKIALNNILDEYQGFNKMSIDALQSTYLDIFEASGMESKIGAVDSNLKLKIESLFSKGVANINANASKEELSKTFDELNAQISASVDLIQESSPYLLFVWALGIILREGLEALIIIVAIVSYLIQSGNAKRLNIAYSALLTGIVLSFITAFFVAWIFKENAGQSRELIEGITMLVAVALLFYVGFWLLSNARNKKWASFIKGQAIEAISNNSAKTLWLTVFLAVYREGAETVLFYQALLFDAKTSSDYSGIFSGLGLGCLILIILYFLLKAGAIKIPIKQFFYVISYIIFYMVFVFTGKGIGELIEGKLITPSFLPIQFEPVLWLGLYPYYETFIPQLIVLTMLIVGIFITHKITKQGVKNV